MTSLANFGWTEKNQRQWDEVASGGTSPARIIADFGTSVKIAIPEVIAAELSGKLAHYTDRELTPKVGDWVSVTLSDNNAVVESVIFRANEIARKVTGRQTVKQIIAANVDIAFVLLSLDKDFSVERLNRFLYQLSTSSVEPVIVLNKADKTDDLGSFTAQLEQLSVPIIITEATSGIGVGAIASHIAPGKTAILLGSSGVGKSTLTNHLLGRDAQATASVKESDGTGKHTTVHRELFILPNGGILIDTPGIKELQLWGTEEDLDATYEDVIAIARQCKYKNCSHTSEAGCAITAALNSGALERKHYANYVKMRDELIALGERTSEKARQSKRWASRKNKDALTEAYDFNEDI
jgi:ribosome biogenesis GTPase